MAYVPITEFQEHDYDHSSDPVTDFPVGKSRFSLDISPISLEFDPVKVGEHSATRNIMLLNNGYDPLTINNVRIVGPYSMVGTLPAVIEPNESADLGIRFSPIVAGTAIGGVYLDTGDSAGEEFITLTGSSVSLIENLSMPMVVLTNNNAGGPNNIIATTEETISPINAAIIIVAKVTQINDSSPVTIKINNWNPLTIKDANNEDVPVGMLKPDTFIIGYRLDNNFQLLL